MMSMKNDFEHFQGRTSHFKQENAIIMSYLSVEINLFPNINRWDWLVKIVKLERSYNISY